MSAEIAPLQPIATVQGLDQPAARIDRDRVAVEGYDVDRLPVRADGGPRVHPVCPQVVDGELWVFVIAQSPKRADLERDGRYALHSFPCVDVDDEFFVIVRPAPAGTRLLLSDATAALDYDIAAEVLEKLDADIGPEDLDDADPFEEGDLGLLSDIGLPEAVLGVIIAELDLYADEQLGRIAREMGFAEELSAVLDRLDR